MNVFTWQKYRDRMKVAAIDLVGQHDDCVFAAAYTWYIIDKARLRTRQLEAPTDYDFAVTGPNNQVMRGQTLSEIPRSQQVWFT
jgi:hypothetical protein